jgi:hypothetical protein
MADDRYRPFEDDDRDDDPDEQDDDEEEEEDDEDGPQRPAVFITTSQPVPLEVARLDDERAPDGVALGAYIGGRLVARSAMPAEAIDRLLALGLFAEPGAARAVRVRGGAGAAVPAVRARAERAAERGRAREEPWKASVPSYEERVARGGDDDDDGPSLETVLLGHIVRFAGDRKHPDDLAAEAVDVLHKILTGGPLSDANSKAVDDLLDSL